MIDRRGPGERGRRIITGDGGHGLGDREDKDTAGQGRSMVMRSATMIVARATFLVLPVAE